MLLALLAPSVVASPVWWEVLPTAPVSLAATAVDGDDLVAVGTDGSLLRMRGGRWAVEAPPPPEGGTAEQVVVAPDGTLWLRGSLPGWVQSFDGAWRPREAVGSNLTGLAFGPDGRAWVVGLHGFVAHRTAAGWEDVPALPLHGAEANLYGCVVDASGTVWARTDPGTLLRIAPDGTATLDPEQALRLPMGIDGQGRVFHTGKRLAVRDPSGWTPRLDRPVQNAAAFDGGFWVVIDGEMHRLVGSDLEPAPLPVAGGALVATASGVAYVVELAAGRVLVSRPGRVPALRDGAKAWQVDGLSNLAPVQVADFDGDGLDDLVAPKHGGGVHVVLQRGAAFVATPVPLEAGTIRGLGACDLDGNGRADLLVRVSDGEEARGGRLRYLRSFPGRFVPVDATGLALLDPSVPGDGAIVCDDADGDGDPDVLVAGGGAVGNGPSLRLLENVGHGRLREVDVARRGFGATGSFAHLPRLGDLDGDGDRDVVVLSGWGDGHTVLEVIEDGVRDVTRRSGLDAVHAGGIVGGWLEDLDRDGRLDLLVADSLTGPRAWRGVGGFRFEESSEVWGLGAAFQPWTAHGEVHVALADLDGDGFLDLFAGNVRRTWLLLGSPEGFVDRSAATPARGSVGGIVTLDLRGDGDLDVFVLRTGDDVLLENALERLPGFRPVAPPEPPAAAPLARRIAWARPWPDLPLAVSLLAAAPLGFLACRRRGPGSRSVTRSAPPRRASSARGRSWR